MGSAPDTELIIIKRSTAAEVRPLRGKVLRPGQPSDQLVYPCDDEPSTLHLVGVSNRQVVGIVSTMQDGDPGDWRIRGMAVEAFMRNQGIGLDMLRRCEAHAREEGGRRLWCNARIGARTLYERIGMAVRGEVFEIPDIGPHQVMSKPLD